ncbi:hypothetical protein WKI68_10820 [Streptomyces sp. MS1.HAVA.3]|uniref:Secreted protein n=1 Tax=Streptomyces caledonius TaxID=3134107 RepID=A0ABU8U2B2_9ACTN
MGALVILLTAQVVADERGNEQGRRRTTGRGIVNQVVKLILTIAERRLGDLSIHPILYSPNLDRYLSLAPIPFDLVRIACGSFVATLPGVSGIPMNGTGMCIHSLLFAKLRQQLLLRAKVPVLFHLVQRQQISTEPRQARCQTGSQHVTHPRKR